MTRWARRVEQGSRNFAAGIRFLVALVIIGQLIYIPIHLVAVPHAGEADFCTAAPGSACGIFLGLECHDGDHHARHSAAQHELKVTRPERAPVTVLALAPAAREFVTPPECPLQLQFSVSGLSPPDLPGCWQFYSRAARPVRAPSFPS
jgi:hypothetical protein